MRESWVSLPPAGRSTRDYGVVRASSSLSPTATHAGQLAVCVESRGHVPRRHMLGHAVARTCLRHTGGFPHCRLSVHTPALLRLVSPSRPQAHDLILCGGPFSC